jgi:hypothetical protein
MILRYIESLRYIKMREKQERRTIINRCRRIRFNFRKTLLEQLTKFVYEKWSFELDDE